MNIEKFIVPSSGLDTDRILSTWRWLIGEDKEIVLLTKFGDLLLKDKADAIYFLSTSDGTIEHLSDHSRDFYNNRLSAEQYLELFQPELIADLEPESTPDHEPAGSLLKEGQVYTFLILPAMGGEKTAKNVRRIELYKHFSLLGDIHHQLDKKNREEFSRTQL